MNRAVDVLWQLIATAFLAAVMSAIWVAASGRYAMEPTPETWFSGPGDLVEVRVP